MLDPFQPAFIAWILLQMNNYFSKVDLENIRNKDSLIGF